MEHKTKVHNTSHTTKTTQHESQQKLEVLSGASEWLVDTTPPVSPVVLLMLVQIRLKVSFGWSHF